MNKQVSDVGQSVAMALSQSGLFVVPLVGEALLC